MIRLFVLTQPPPRKPIELIADINGPISLSFSRHFTYVPIPDDHECIGRLYYTNKDIDNANLFIEDIQIGVGGTVEYGESKKIALRRECREESQELLIQKASLISTKHQRYDVYDITLGLDEHEIENNQSIDNPSVWGMAHAPTRFIYEYYVNHPFTSTYGEKFNTIVSLDHTLLKMIDDRFTKCKIPSFDQTRYLRDITMLDRNFHLAVHYRSVHVNFRIADGTPIEAIEYLKSLKQCPHINQEAVYESVEPVWS
jgi:hypothetical protein